MDAVILAAGEGTRLRPLTSTRPKPMLPVGGKTILEWGLEALAAGGVDKAVIVVGYKKEVISGFFGKEYAGIKIEYVEQKEQLGTAHAVSMAEGKVTGEFYVMNGDLLVSESLIEKFLSDHKKNKSHNSMCLVKVEDPKQFGIVELKGTLVRGIEEKPDKPKSDHANAGIYIFGQEIFDAIRKVKKSERLEYEITDAIEMLIDNERMSGYKIGGTWMDIGRPWDLLAANEIILKDMKTSIDKKAEIEQYSVLKGKVHVGKGTVIRSGSYIEGPCYIGESCTIGPNCYIRPSTFIWDKVHIGNAVEIKNSIIMSDTNVGHLS